MITHVYLGMVAFTDARQISVWSSGALSRAPTDPLLPLGGDV